MLLSQSLFAQNIHLFTVGNPKSNQNFVELAKKVANHTVLHQNISEANQLIETLLNTEFELDDKLILVYSGKVVRNNYFEMDGLQFNHEYFNHLLDSTKFALAITIFNTDTSDQKLEVYQNTITKLFTQKGKVAILCHDLKKFSEHLEKSNWTNVDTTDLRIEAHLIPTPIISTFIKSNLGSANINQYDLVPFTVLRPTSSKDIPKETLQNCKNLGQVNAILRKALKDTQYHEHRYYGMPNGFALVARMEKIDEYGVPFKGKERWQIGIQPTNPLDYIKAIFAAPKGYYRVIAFIVTDELFNSNTPATEQKVNAWFKSKRKITELPSDVAAFSYPQDKKGNSPYQVIAFIYEFQTSDIGEKPKLLGEGQGTPQSALEHLDAAGLWKNLNPKSKK